MLASKARTKTDTKHPDAPKKGFFPSDGRGIVVTRFHNDDDDTNRLLDCECMAV